MKFTCQVHINASRERAGELFRDVSRFGEWQEGFISHYVIDGQENEVGTKSRIHLEHEGRSIVLVETVLGFDLPSKFEALYEHEHMVNTLIASFIPSKEGVICRLDIEYTKFNGLLPRLMGLFFPNRFKKQTQHWLENFKRFVEQQ